MPLSEWPRLRPEEFSALFTSFKKSAFRLELNQVYLVDDEAEQFAAFLAGRSFKWTSDDFAWCKNIRTARLAGKAFQRVRRIALPLSDYTRFELIGYRQTIEAGEEIRAFESNTPECFHASVPVLSDFWLFDDALGIAMEYDAEGHYLGARRMSPQHVGAYVTLKKEALQISKRIEEFSFWPHVD